MPDVQEAKCFEFTVQSPPQELLGGGILLQICLKGSDRLRKVDELSIFAQTQDLQIFKKFNMSQMNRREVFHNISRHTNSLVWAEL